MTKRQTKPDAILEIGLLRVNFADGDPTLDVCNPGGDPEWDVSAEGRDVEAVLSELLAFVRARKETP